MKIRAFFPLAALLFIHIPLLQAQEEVWDNATRALYILDIAKYVQYDDKIQSHADFKIGVLGKDNDFVMEL